MNAVQPPAQNDKRIVFVALWLIMDILLALASLLLLGAQPFLFIVVMALGMIVGMLRSRRRYPVWLPLVMANSSRQEVKWYVGFGLFVGSLFLLFSPIIANHLTEPLKTMFMSVLLGALTGYLVGYHLWPVGLYANRNRAKSR